MGDTLSFKCPCCAAPLSFSGGTGQLTCEYCGASFTVEQAKAAQEAEREDAASSDMTWTSTAPALITDENGKVSGYRCNSCGAEMVADEKTAATECPYCGNNAIIAQSFDGMYQPDLVVPFTVDRKRAQEALREFYRGKKLLPRTFTESNRVENMTGLYVPFWLMSCHTSGSVTFEGVKTKRWDDASFEYEKKDTYRVVRSGEMDFKHIPVDASTKMDDDTMDSLEPYDVTRGVAYDAAYFSGYLADRFDVTAAQAQPRASERVTATFRSKMEEAARRDYDYIDKKSESIRISDTKTEYAMLPVWMLSTRFEGKTYSFAMNGQTGQVAGSLPVDKGAYSKQLAVGSLIAAVILAALVFLFGGRTFHPIGTAIAVAVGVLIGFLRANGMKAAMNTIAKKRQAKSYLIDSSIRQGAKRDLFLFSKTEKREKQKKQ
ncbi:MAG: hypothetical protein E7425_01750 [Ruminococcaceae bacterium]|jgi:DNA-directed RNA polymerase subunit RPC12/RpoP|nr:hypothetical protein [Oscillospiraceae bacterium]